jgi:hypothetical protein
MSAGGYDLLNETSEDDVAKAGELAAFVMNGQMPDNCCLFGIG